jgi:hypothetical protein
MARALPRAVHGGVADANLWNTPRSIIPAAVSLLAVGGGAGAPQQEGPANNGTVHCTRTLRYKQHRHLRAVRTVRAVPVLRIYTYTGLLASAVTFYCINPTTTHCSRS